MNDGISRLLEDQPPPIRPFVSRKNSQMTTTLPGTNQSRIVWAIFCGVSKQGARPQAQRRQHVRHRDQPTSDRDRQRQPIFRPHHAIVTCWALRSAITPARQLAAALGAMRKITRRIHRETIEPFRGGAALAAACHEMLFNPTQMRALDARFPASIFQLMRISE